MTEDSAATRARLTKDLSDSGDLAIVGCADTEIGGLTWLVEHPHGWDLTIVDLNSDPEGGLRMLSACRVRRPNQKVALLRSHTSPDLWRRCRGLGADVVVDKLGDSASLLRYCARLKGGALRSGGRGTLARLGHFLRTRLATLMQGRIRLSG